MALGFSRKVLRFLTCAVQLKSSMVLHLVTSAGNLTSFSQYLHFQLGLLCHSDWAFIVSQDLVFASLKKERNLMSQCWLCDESSAITADDFIKKANSSEIVFPFYLQF